MEYKLSKEQVDYIIEEYFYNSDSFTQHNPRDVIAEIERRLNFFHLVETEEDFFEIVATVVEDSAFSYDVMTSCLVETIAKYYSNNLEVLKKLAAFIGYDPIELTEEDELDYDGAINRFLGYVPSYEGLSEEMDDLYPSYEEIDAHQYFSDYTVEDFKEQNFAYSEKDFEDDVRLKEQTKKDKSNKRNGR